MNRLNSAGAATRPDKLVTESRVFVPPSGESERHQANAHEHARPLTDYFLITCEHGGNRIPALYREPFERHGALLLTHRGYDPGALVMARELAGLLAAPLVASTISRLLIDLNRSIGHQHLYSEATRNMTPIIRHEIVKRYYLPYRNKAERLVRRAVADGGRLVHISSHSFTPKLNGVQRDADVGLLYAPGRPGELELCTRWQADLKATAPRLKVRRNYPYQGKADGLTTHLRRCFPPSAYVGIELEINQKHVKAGRSWRALRALIAQALRHALASTKRDSSASPVIP